MALHVGDHFNHVFDADTCSLQVMDEGAITGLPTTAQGQTIILTLKAP